jgi:L-2,4-diaminobutyric acid acetyltransferase
MSESICFRSAHRGDASALWQLVQSTGTLELNTPYFYLAFAEFFGDTCLVAIQNEQLVGGVIAFRLPRRPEVLFVWQIGVLPAARRQGLAKRILQQLIELPACADARFVQATIADDNAASQRLFQSFAESFNVPCEREKFFTADLFPNTHDAEDSYLIGPLPARAKD